VRIYILDNVYCGVYSKNTGGKIMRAHEYGEKLNEIMVEYMGGRVRYEVMVEKVRVLNECYKDGGGYEY
jgi:hypothetical protein